MNAPHQNGGVEAADTRLWALAVSGMDEVHPAPDRATAQLWAMQHTVMIHNWRPIPKPFDPIVNFTVCEWPWSAESHRDGLAESIKANARPEQTTDPTTTAAKTLRDDELITPEQYNRICANIRAKAGFRGEGV